MADWIYVDNSNVFIEGKRLSAVKSGEASSIWDAMDNNITDDNYRMNLGKLYEFVAGDTTRNENNVARAMLFGSRPPPNDYIWELAEKVGFETIIHDRNAGNKEKKIDVEIAMTMTEDALKKAKLGDIFTLVSGDADYVPLIERISEDFETNVVFWGNAASELKNVCSKFIPLDDHFEFLRL